MEYLLAQWENCFFRLLEDLSFNVWDAHASVCNGFSLFVVQRRKKMKFAFSVGRIIYFLKGAFFISGLKAIKVCVVTNVCYILSMKVQQHPCSKFVLLLPFWYLKLHVLFWLQWEHKASTHLSSVAWFWTKIVKKWLLFQGGGKKFACWQRKSAVKQRLF